MSGCCFARQQETAAVMLAFANPDPMFLYFSNNFAKKGRIHKHRANADNLAKSTSRSLPEEQACTSHLDTRDAQCVYHRKASPNRAARGHFNLLVELPKSHHSDEAA